MACDATYKINIDKTKPINVGYFFNPIKLPIGFALLISKALLFSLGKDSGKIK